jgi:hypothetical protein
MMSLQIRNIEAIRRMSNLVFDSTEAIARQQANFFQNGFQRMTAAFDRDGGPSTDPKTIFEQQGEAYRDLFGAFTSHASELAEITSKCCSGLIQEATSSMVSEAEEAGQGGNGAKAAGDRPAAAKQPEAKA